MLSVQDAFARRRADAAGDLREIVGRVQVARRLFPVAGVDEVVPVRDLVVDRAAGRRVRDGVGAVTIRHAAIHAARGLLADVLLRKRQNEFFVVAIRSSTGSSPGRCARTQGNPVTLPITSHSETRSIAATVSDDPFGRNRAVGGAPYAYERDGGDHGERRATDSYSAACIAAACSFFISASARRYSTGITLRNFGKRRSSLREFRRPALSR